MSDRNISRDVIGILLNLVIGISGLIFVFSIPNPFTALAPQIPMLTPQDWPGSYASIGLGISTGWPWHEKREFSNILVLNTGTDYGEIAQTAIWYADPIKAAAAWDQLNTESYKEQPIVASSRGDDQPASMLFCGKLDLPEDMPQDLRECWYLAYWEHWYIEVNYRGPFEEGNPPLEIGRITIRVDQLLMSAPDEPCYGIICTGTAKEIKP